MAGKKNDGYRVTQRQRKSFKKKIRVGLVLESLTKNDAIGNNFRKAEQALQKLGFYTYPVVGYTNIPQYKKYQAVFARNIDIRSVRKLIVNPKKYIPKAREKIQSLFKKNMLPDCDIYLINFSSYSPLMDIILNQKKGLKIVDFHGITPPKFSKDATFTLELKKAIGQIRLLKKTNIVLVHSQYILDQVKKVRSNNNLIAPLALFSYISNKKGRTLSKNGKFKILFVGRISEHKGIHILIRALSKLKIPFECRIAGDYSTYFSMKYYKKLNEQLKRLNLVKKVKFLGRIPDDILRKEFKKTNLFVTASFHEGFCIPIVEAMSYGIPVIGSDSSAIPSTIGKGGLCFKTGDPEDLKNKITELFNNPVKYSWLSKKAIKEAHKYTEATYLKFYRNLLSRFYS